MHLVWMPHRQGIGFWKVKHEFEGLKDFVNSLALMPLSFENIELDILFMAISWQLKLWDY